MDTTDQPTNSKQSLGQIFPIVSVDPNDRRIKAIFKKKFRDEVDLFFRVAVATQRDLTPATLTLENFTEILSSSIDEDEQLDRSLRLLVEIVYKTWLGFIESQTEQRSQSVDQLGVQFVSCLFKLFQLRMEPERPKGMESKSKNDPNRFVIRERLERVELEVKSILRKIEKEPWVPLVVWFSVENASLLIREALFHWAEVLSLHANNHEVEKKLFNELTLITQSKELAAKVFDAVIFELRSLNFAASADAYQWPARVRYPK